MQSITERKTFPYHVHIEDEKNVRPSKKMDLERALKKISQMLLSS